MGEVKSCFYTESLSVGLYKTDNRGPSYIQLSGAESRVLGLRGSQEPVFISRIPKCSP